MANHHQTAATTPREMKKSASGVRKAMVLSASMSHWRARRLRHLTGICSIRFRPASRPGAKGELCICRIFVPARTREVMAFKRLSRRQFAGITGWSLLGMSALSAGSSRADPDNEDGLQTGRPLPVFRTGFCGGRRPQPIRSRGPSTKTAAAHRFGTVSPTRAGPSPITATPTPRPTIIICTRKTFS